ncbi:AMP-binding protein [Sneathiella marina]|uniref:AMP-binding protein n=1 Tax=Sneathiella marina TaxID=2950108 RepID=A0ABY4W9U1_9PROT|nr:AMP-binding protein [Sneathiella marina]USG62530.1 AMP-binding protein [Sneathiella marina]
MDSLRDSMAGALQEKGDIFPKNGLSYVAGDRSKPLIKKTIPEVFRETVAKFGPRDAIIVPAQDVALSYYDLDREIDLLASGLLALGLEKGDRIGIWSPNNLEWILSQYATARIGLILVNINPAYRLSELEYALKKSGCTALITAEKFKSSHYFEMIRTLVPELALSEQVQLESKALPNLKFVIGIHEDPGAGILAFTDIMKLGGPAQQLRLEEITKSLSPDDPINIQFTSGTTGAPKGATLTHSNIINNAANVVGRMNFSETDRLCIPVPLYHCFGMVMGSLGCVTQGACMVFPGEAFEPEETLKAVSETQCTALYGVPTMFVALLDHPHLDDFDLSTLRTGIMAGAPCPIEVMKQVVAQLNMSEVTIAYGMTETSPVSFQSNVDDPIEKRVATVGRIHPNIEVKIMDEGGEITQVGTKGELWTRGYSVMQGYWDDAEKTKEVIVDGGWMKTGDLAILDEEGYCAIVGRLKDMIIRGGENIYPREVEEFLFTHPDIQDVQIFGIPHEKFGEEVCCWIVPQSGAKLNEGDVKSYCKNQIAHYKVPKHVRIVSELPMTVTGKPQKFVMRDQMMELLNQP